MSGRAFQPVCPEAGDLIHRSARGDIEAQSALFRWCLERVGQTPGILVGEVLHAAEIVGRLAASHGGIEERRSLARFLLVKGNHLLSREEEGLAVTDFAESLAIFNQLADEGDEMAACEANAFVANTSPAIIEAARNFVPPSGEG